MKKIWQTMKNFAVVVIFHYFSMIFSQSYKEQVIIILPILSTQKGIL